jgi:hypothetical protein
MKRLLHKEYVAHLNTIYVKNNRKGETIKQDKKDMGKVAGIWLLSI